MRLLAVDYGTKRFGLAWSDTTLGVVLPFGQIEKKTSAATRRELAELVKQERIDKLVVGFPVGLNGRENSNTERVKQFVFALQKEISVPIEYFDERFSSQAGDKMGPGVSRDEKAAMVILQGYLDKNNK